MAEMTPEERTRFMQSANTLWLVLFIVAILVNHVTAYSQNTGFYDLSLLTLIILGALKARSLNW